MHYYSQLEDYSFCPALTLEPFQGRYSEMADKNGVMETRACIHCGKALNEGCKCEFKRPRNMELVLEFSQQSVGITVGEMKRTISEYFQNNDRKCTFKITVYLLPDAGKEPA